MGRVRADSRWHRRRKSGAVRKILAATNVLRYVYVSSLVSWVMAAIGIALYLLVFRSSIILVESFVWLVEAISFLGLALSFKIAASRTIFYRARYEVLRIEALSTLVLAVVGVGVTLGIAWKAVSGFRAGGVEPTPILLSIYPLASAAISYILESFLQRKLRSVEYKLQSVRAIIEKLKYDVVLEAAGGAAIIVANIASSTLFEASIVVVVAAYVVYGLGSLAVNSVLYIVGPGPSWERERIRALIREGLARRGHRYRQIRVESYGTFAEAEVWVEYVHDATLLKAHREARSIARELVNLVPELLRVVVIMVPVKSVEVKRYKRITASK